MISAVLRWVVIAQRRARVRSARACIALDVFRPDDRPAVKIYGLEGCDEAA